MAEHTPTPWMTSRAGEMLPDDWMIAADMGKTSNGIQQISTVARALSIRQTPETTAANAAFIVRAVNNHEASQELLTDIWFHFSATSDPTLRGIADRARALLDLVGSVNKP